MGVSDAGGDSVARRPRRSSSTASCTTQRQPGAVVALDARTGRQIWRYDAAAESPQPVRDQPVQPRRRASLGHRLFVGTLDAVLVALDASTGRLLWEMQVADSMLGYSITSPPLIVKDKVLVGSPAANSARADSSTPTTSPPASGCGALRVPGPGEFGNDTWKGDSWKRGGSPTWLTGSYDPELNLVYWPVGNPGPQIDRIVRGDGDNLFSDSVVAHRSGHRTAQVALPVHAERRARLGFGQDSMLVDRVWRGQPRKLLLHADRNGHLLRARSDERQVPVRHAVRATRTGTAGSTPTAGPFVPGSNSSPEGSFFVYPTLGRRHELPGAVVQPATGWFYLAYAENGQQYVSAPVPFEQGRQYIGRARRAAAVGRARASRRRRPASRRSILRRQDGWDFKIFQGSLTNGVLATAGHVVFARSATATSSRSTQEPAAPVALPDRRHHGGLAHELRRRRPAVRRDRGGQHVYAFALPEAAR